jgi:hypothetical protein
LVPALDTLSCIHPSKNATTKMSSCSLHLSSKLHREKEQQ